MAAIRSYFICASPRTGGSLLCEALESTRIAGRPQEYFEPTTDQAWFDRLGARSHAEYFPKVLTFGSTPNGVFGAKVIWPQFEHLTAALRLNDKSGMCDRDRLARTFPDLRYIFLTRSDKVRQAVSYDRAIQTDVWHSVRQDVHGATAGAAPARAGASLRLP